jgi:hypothetical protein
VYRSGLSLSTRLASASAEDLHAASVKAADPPVLLIDDFSHGARDWFVPAAGPNLLLRERKLFQSGPGLAPDDEQRPLWRMATRKVGDPKWRGRSGSLLQLHVQSAEQGSMVVMVTEDEFRRPGKARSFVANVALKGEPNESVKLAVSDFQIPQGDERLASWDRVNLLTLQAPASASDDKLKLLRRIEWISPVRQN